MTVNRTKQVTLAVVTGLGGQFVMTALTFVLVPIILQFTSESLYGFWVTSLAVLGYLGLVDLGLSVSLVRLVAAIPDEGHDEKLSRAASTAFFSFCGMALILLCTGLALARYIPVWFKVPEAEVAVVIRTYRILIVAGVLAMPLSAFRAIIAGVQRMAVGNLIGSFSSAVGFGLTMLLLYRGVGLASLAISRLVVVVAGGVVAYGFCKGRYCRRLKISPRLINRHDLARLWSFGGLFQLGRIANMVATSTDAVLIAVVLGVTAVAPYALTSKLAILISITVASKLPVAVFPALSQMFARQEMDSIRHAFITLTYYSSRLAILGAAFVLIANRHFVSIWVGSELFGGTALNLVFVSWVLLDTIFRSGGAVVQASGELRHWALASVVEAVMNIVISLALVGTLGLVGIALGTIISRTLTTGIYIPVRVCRRLELPVRSFLWRGVGYPMCRSLPGIICMMIVGRLVPAEGGWGWLLCVAVTAVLANVISFEGLQLARPSDEPWRRRLRSILTLSPSQTQC